MCRGYCVQERKQGAKCLLWWRQLCIAYECEPASKRESEGETESETGSQCVCCVQKNCVHACQTCLHQQLSSRQRFQSGSSMMRWIKANVSGPTLWLTTNSIQTLFKHSAWTKSQTPCDRESLHSAKWFIIIPTHSLLIWPKTTRYIEQCLDFLKRELQKVFTEARYTER